LKYNNNNSVGSIFKLENKFGSVCQFPRLYPIILKLEYELIYTSNFYIAKPGNNILKCHRKMFRACVFILPKEEKKIIR
jgi:hypothetical protein